MFFHALTFANCPAGDIRKRGQSQRFSTSPEGPGER